MNPPFPPPPLRSARIIWLEVAEFRIVSEAVGCARDRKRTWWEQPCEPLPPPLQAVCEAVHSCFRISAQGSLSELLRHSAEATLRQMIASLFSR